MMSLANTHFDPTFLRIFLDQIAVYPLDSIVRITTGEIALVIRVIPGLQTRPTLKVIVDAEGHRLKNGPEIDLTKHLTIFITKIFTPGEILTLAANLA
jgi:hypothetical protein